MPVRRKAKASPGAAAGRAGVLGQLGGRSGHGQPVLVGQQRAHRAVQPGALARQQVTVDRLAQEGMPEHVALGAVGHGARVGREQGRLHPRAIEYTRAQQISEAMACARRHDIGEHAEVVVHIGKAGARRELQRAGSADDARCFGIAERCLGRRARSAST